MHVAVKHVVARNEMQSSKLLRNLEPQACKGLHIGNVTWACTSLPEITAWVRAVQQFSCPCVLMGILLELLASCDAMLLLEEERGKHSVRCEPMQSAGFGLC